MEQYDPKKAPDPEVWLALDEDERIFLVESFHSTAGEEAPEGGSTLHATFHVIVENQVALGTGLVRETIAKLTRQGLHRHEAIHAVGSILTENIFEALQSNQDSFDVSQYRRKLEKITAKKWKRGTW